MNGKYLQQKRQIEIKTATYSPVTDVAAFRKFALFTTNLGLALPEIPLACHLSEFRRAIVNRQLCFLDEECFGGVSWSWSNDGTLDVESRKSCAAIIATFHVGSYRFITHLLVRNGVPIALLVSDTVKERQGADFLSQASAVGDGAFCTLISADHPMVGLRILRALKKGITVVGYLDGNRGAPAQQHVHRLPFLGLDIRVRTGLAHLARRGRVPLHGVLSRRHADGRIEIWKSRSFYETPVSVREVTPAAATGLLYNDLTNIIREEPWQWDQWYYLHETFLTD